MPLLAIPGAALTPPGGPAPAAAPAPVPLRVTYTDSDGVVWPWWDVASGCFATSVAGLGASPSAMSYVTLPTGERLPTSVMPAAGQLVAALYAWDDDQAALLARADALARALTHDRAGGFAAGTLVVARPDGTSRQMPVACTSGADVPDDDGMALTTSLTLGLTFDKLSPFWADAEPTVVVIAAPPSSAGVPPMPPVILAPSTVLGVTSVDNSGDADAWPVWTITGPGTSLLGNTTTGRSFSFATPLDSGEQRIVDTRPGMQSAVDAAGTDWWGDLVKSSPRDLWQLVPGTNDLNLALAGSGAGSQIQLSYVRRWRRA